MHFRLHGSSAALNGRASKLVISRGRAEEEGLPTSTQWGIGGSFTMESAADGGKIASKMWPHCVPCEALGQPLDQACRHGTVLAALAFLREQPRDP